MEAADVSSEKPMPSVKPIQIRATVHLPGLGLGQIAWTDPTVPFVAMCLRTGYIVRVNEPETP